MTTHAGVYKITNLVNGKLYIGSSKNLDLREKKHRWSLVKGNHRNKHLQAAWNMYGEDSFVFEKLLICSDENLLMYEQHFIDGMGAVSNGYNICPVAGSAMSGRKWSEESRRKASEARRGRVLTEEHKKKIGLGNIGIKRNLGRVLSDDHKGKIRAAMIGRVFSAESLARMSAAQMGNKSNLGKSLSDEHKAKLSAARKGIVFSPETKRKMSESGKLRCARERAEREGQ